jgi:hypothetical protein
VAVSRSDILAFLRAQKYAVEASTSAAGGPQAAVVGIVVTDRLEIFFDTLASSRKHANLSRDPRVAFVVWEGERTVQYEGVADFPHGAALDALKAIYFARFPEGRDRAAWPGITYVRVWPTWVRYGDFGGAAPLVVELGADELR